jgi:hypothetical protein
MDTATLQQKYAAIKEEATRLAGSLEDIPRRAIVLHNLYLDSGENHVFSQIATHGALWAYRYFEVGGWLGRVIANRYFYNAKEKQYRLGLLQSFAEGFRKVNRLVCIDTYTNYHFARQYGETAGAETLIPPTLLDALNRVHTARRAQRSLTPAEKREVFQASFHCEQEVTVAPGVKAAVAEFECRVLKFLCLRPVVRFAYFPSCAILWFGDFSATAERIAKGVRAYDYAERVGWERVKRSMRHYRLLPERVFTDPRGCFEEIRQQTRGEAVAGASG